MKRTDKRRAAHADRTLTHTFEPGQYQGQIVWEELLLAEFSLTVAEAGEPATVLIDAQSLCAGGPRKQHHYELSSGSKARFESAGNHTICMARREAAGFRLVFDSSIDAPARAMISP